MSGIFDLERNAVPRTVSPARIALINETLTALAAADTALDARLDTAETDIGLLEVAGAGLETRVDALEASPYASWTPVFSNITVGSVLLARYWQRGKHVSVQCTVQFSSAATGAIFATLPVQAAAAWRGILGYGMCRGVDSSAGQGVGGMCKIETGGTQVTFWRTDGTPAAEAAWSNTVPFTWANTDFLTFWLAYETV